MTVKQSDIDNLKYLIKCADPWYVFVDNLECGETAKDVLYSAKKIVKKLERLVKTKPREERNVK